MTKVRHYKSPALWFVFPCLSVSSGVTEYVRPGSRYWMLNVHFLFWTVGWTVYTEKAPKTA